LNLYDKSFRRKDSTSSFSSLKFFLLLNGELIFFIKKLILVALAPHL